MGMIEMLSLLIAIILFSTIFIAMYHNISIALDIVYNGIYQLQGQKIVDKYIQKIEAELLGKIFSFSDLYYTFNSFSDTKTVGNIQYNISTQASYCDSIGNALPDTTLDFGFRIIDISVWCLSPTSSDTLWIGTSANPIQTVFASYE